VYNADFNRLIRDLNMRTRPKFFSYLHCVPKKYTPGCLTITLANVDRFPKFFHQVICREILYLHTQRFSPHLQYVGILPCEIRQSKKVAKFSRRTWQLICLTKISCEILCNLPQKYCTDDFTYICVQYIEYSVERTETVRR